MSKTIFVTGGAGYVGSHCAKAFAQAGWTVVTYDNLSRGHRDLVKWGPLIEGDILEFTCGGLGWVVSNVTEIGI